MEKICNKKNFNNFVCTPLCSRVNIYINFLPSSLLYGVCSQKLFPLFATGVAAGVVDTNGNLRLALLTPAENLPPVSTSRAELVAKFAASVVYTGGKFATGVVDTGGSP
jgi:hypothetical protein